MADITQIIWDDEPGKNVDHLAEHGVTPEEAEAVIAAYFDVRKPSLSNPTHWVARGFTPAGRFLMVVFEYIEDLDVVIPVTAYEPQER